MNAILSQPLAGRSEASWQGFGQAHEARRSEAALLRQIGTRDLALEKIKQGLCVFDGEQRLLLFNQRYAEMYNIAPGRLRPGMTLREVVDLRFESGTGPNMSREQYAAWRGRIAVADRATETVIELGNGAVYRIHHEPTPGGGWVATHEDITERREREAHIRHMAHNDALTGLPNRALFTEHLEELADGRRHCGELLAVLFLDLDHFKEVNDTLGHSAGDGLLRQAAGRIRAVLHGGDVLARLGGDEFAVILHGIQRPEQASNLAARVIEALAAPFVLEGQEATVTASIGIALHARTGERFDPGVLLRRADMALYRAKGEGRGTYRFFEAGMDTRLQRRKAMERDLRQALADGQLELHYQPQFSLATRRVTGAEALLRWRHPEQGYISPADFIPLAESTGLILPIGAWVLRTACAQAARWPGRLAVNLSPLQVRKPGLARFVADVLRETGMAPERLELEITEGVLMQDTAQTLATLDAIKGLGVGIALDDFGTGYSSLSYLRRFPFSKMKIDRSFVQNVAEEGEAAAIVRAVATLGRSLDMRVVAEGVETAEQLRVLQAAGCDEVQGFLLGRPMPRDEFERLVADQGA